MTTISPSGPDVPISTFSCPMLSDCGYAAEVPAPGSSPGAWYGIEIRRTDGTIEPMSYDLSISSASELPCSNGLPSFAAFPCRLDPGPGIAASLSSPTDEDQLWFQAEEGRVYVLDLGGRVTASLYAPTYYQDPGGSRPGTTRDDRPMFRYSSAWPHPITMVAPLTGLYRLRVSADGGGERSNYFARVYESRWSEVDFPTLDEWAGPTVRCGLP